MHPYNSWTAGQAPSSSWPQDPAPSILGALPYPAVSHATTLVTYHITSSGSHILNSRVIGSDGRTYFTISTDRDMPGYTVVKDAQDNPIALVEWKSPPLHVGDFNRTFLANVSKIQNSIAIQITSDAINQRLLESVIIAAMLLQCGRNID
ncbi:hypothetical protein C0989_003657 [Termitomyces sp. Mn162]|nr:hypothetical protein C0989_003657 [Termitomyces sp. Mn162]